MAEPDNHTLRLLREFREEFGQFRSEFNAFRTETRVEVSDFRAETASTLVDVRDRVDSLTRAVAGEIVQAKYVTAGVDDRIADIERRLSELEQSR
jgi:hypothetical protein